MMRGGSSTATPVAAVVAVVVIDEPLSKKGIIRAELITKVSLIVPAFASQHNPTTHSSTPHLQSQFPVRKMAKPRGARRKQLC